LRREARGARRAARARRVRPAQGGPAAAGNSGPLSVVVSVTDTNGVPVTGLAAADFTINAIIVGAGGSLVELDSVGDFQHGDYLLEVVPISDQETQYTWAFGRYIFFLHVAHGGDQGQTLCDVFIH
jgi:hypothetical protein